MEIYIPTMEELEQLQSMGINIYNYIIAKVVEVLIIEDVVAEEIDMYDVIYDYLRDHPEIIYSICRMYPKKISDSIITSKDAILCRNLIEDIPKEDRTIYRLDDILMNFDESILLDKGIVKSTSSFLAKNLSSCPKYRFDYQGPNILLDSIFTCELPTSKISPDSFGDFIKIDPIYSVKLGLNHKTKKGKLDLEIPFLVQRGMAIYNSRYGIDGSLERKYQGKDIVNKPDENVKRLMKVLEYHKQNY